MVMRHRDPPVSYQSYVDRECVDAWAVVNQLPTYPIDEPQRLRKTGTTDVPDTTDRTRHPYRHPEGIPNVQFGAIADLGSNKDAGSNSGAEVAENLKKSAHSREFENGWATGLEPATPRTTT